MNNTRIRNYCEGWSRSGHVHSDKEITTAWIGYCDCLALCPVCLAAYKKDRFDKPAAVDMTEKSP